MVTAGGRPGRSVLEAGRLLSLLANTNPTRKRGILRKSLILLPRLRFGLVFLNVKN
jgi:hypothetical protein